MPHRSVAGVIAIYLLFSYSFPGTSVHVDAVNHLVAQAKLVFAHQFTLPTRLVGFKGAHTNMDRHHIEPVFGKDSHVPRHFRPGSEENLTSSLDICRQSRDLLESLGMVEPYTYKS